MHDAVTNATQADAGIFLCISHIICQLSEISVV